jgi:hypothetical protein
VVGRNDRGSGRSSVMSTEVETSLSLCLRQKTATALRPSERRRGQSRAVSRMTEWRTATEPWSATRSLGHFPLSVMSTPMETSLSTRLRDLSTTVEVTSIQPQCRGTAAGLDSRGGLPPRGSRCSVIAHNGLGSMPSRHGCEAAVAIFRDPGSVETRGKIATTLMCHAMTVDEAASRHGRGAAVAISARPSQRHFSERFLHSLRSVEMTRRKRSGRSK